MNQFESDTLRLAIGLFVLFCFAFGFFRYRFRIWISLPRIVMVSCVGWFVSSLVLFIAARTSTLQGLLFAYFAVVLMSAPLLAAGMFELVLGTYAAFTISDRTKNLPARSHFIAALSTLACVGAYCVARGVAN